MKTRGGGTRVSTTDPESYFYAKFAIAAGHNNFTLKARNFSSVNATFFKLTAITEDGTVKHIIPTASVGEAAADGCWKFCHEDGSADNPAMTSLSSTERTWFLLSLSSRARQMMTRTN